MGLIGENLAYSTSESQDFTKEYDTTSTETWYNENKDYDWDKAEFSEATAQFTQVVWKETTKLGCGHASDGPNVYVTCRYDPLGNGADKFKDNVLVLVTTP